MYDINLNYLESTHPRTLPRRQGQFIVTLRKIDGEMGRWGDGEMGRWGDGEMGKWGDGEMGRWGNGGPTPNPSQEGNVGRWRDLYICTIKCISDEYSLRTKN
ncbi:hypothetical protein CYANOKiyG1_22830 [Okeania sp. KiyG1]|nr:hypothetical protein CYANOKiyG1_22830 [Okeania sp. KiyG1]